MEKPVKIVIDRTKLTHFQLSAFYDVRNFILFKFHFHFSDHCFFICNTRQFAYIDKFSVYRFFSSVRKRYIYNQIHQSNFISYHSRVDSVIPCIFFIGFCVFQFKFIKRDLFTENISN